MSQRLDRRSFLTRIVGASAVASGALGAVTGLARAQAPAKSKSSAALKSQHATARTDQDDADPAGYGRTGHSDEDNMDSAGRGRTNWTDKDAHDIQWYGRGGYSPHGLDSDGQDIANGCLACNRTGRTDKDGFDTPGYGRSGLNDHDSSDRAEHGRVERGGS